MFESAGFAASAAGNEGHKTSRYGRLFRACSMAVAIALAAALAACSSSSSSSSSQRFQQFQRGVRLDAHCR